MQHQCVQHIQTTFSAFDASPNWLNQAQLLSHHSVWFGDTANVDTLFNDSAFRADILSWASDSSLVASMGSRVLLEFVCEQLDDDSIGQYIIEEVSEYPAYTPTKRFISKSDDDESEILDELNFTAYPNPFGSSIIFNVDNEMVEEIIITDILGVLIDRIVMGENQQQIEWQAQLHAPGVYIAVAHGTGQTKALKIVKY